MNYDIVLVVCGTFLGFGLAFNLDSIRRTLKSIDRKLTTIEESKLESIYTRKTVELKQPGN